MPLSIHELKARYQVAKARRQTWEPHWQEVADLVRPTHDFTVERHAGEKRNDKIFDTTAPSANISLGAALHGLLSNPSTWWHSVVTEDFDLRVDKAVREYLYEATKRGLSYLASDISGFPTASDEIYQDLAAFGTSVCEVMERKGLLQFRAKQLAKFYMDEDSEGTQMETHRQFSDTARNLVRIFGRKGDTLSDDIKTSADRESTGRDTKFSVIHTVCRRTDRDVTRRDSRNMPWASVYWEEKTTSLIREGGFRENPYLTPRWSKAPEEIFGRSPAISVLPAIKVINAMTRTVLVAGEQAVHPPLNVPANGIEGPIRTAPGSLNYYRTGTSQFASPLITGANPRIGQDMIERVAKQIEKAYFLDALELPELDRMTAEEVITRRQQGLLKASPVLSRLYAEFLRPVVIRTYQWLRRTKRLPPPPESLRGITTKVDFRSPMAQSQKASETGAILTALNSSVPLINTDPNVMQNVNGDLAFRAIWEQSNADPTLLRDKREVEQQRAAAAQAEQMAQQVALAGGAAAAAKDAAAAGKDVRGGG
jgi:hypothetical protein